MTNGTKKEHNLILAVWLADKHIILNSTERYNRFYELASRATVKAGETASNTLFEVLSQVMKV
ncbi:hypothetical protein M0R04_15015 [Candidatus Dojkabacteria bacterium]|jgi:hypothetical protein|nr:hypothetical protein [Candidatus Dojkabacteria bacterium]